ncbi:MAG: T9SS type A sorting domain-containing protein [Lentimicrobium sp.]|uniref:T9SS type A sorting domain-containing protein n=1 Tax=Lentimicrobium sp. TaxID=2034841 RepID=UPI00260056E8|nr:T9SS type A sorting domain-containing protein [Lentimicrobium sp.]MCO5255722.1 T9SS type A sorting domain-containing protein [Lentimicrobium sp.]
MNYINRKSLTATSVMLVFLLLTLYGSCIDDIMVKNRNTAFYSNGISATVKGSFTSEFLFPPRNFTAETYEFTNYCYLAWEAPEDPQHPGQAVPGIVSFRIYRNQMLIAEVASDTVGYYDLNLPPAQYFYEITAVYDLTSYGFPGQTGESMKEGPVEIFVVYGYEIPFNENFNTGIFETNQWTVEGANWRIAGQTGNPAPSAEFFSNPLTSNYSQSITSYYLMGQGIIDGNIMLEFDLKHTLVNPTGQEKLSVEVFDGNNWVQKEEIVNINNLDWKNYKLDITEEAKDKIFRVRFIASGDSTPDIYNWLIDNISVYRECAPPQEFTAGVFFPFVDGVTLEWEAPSGNTGGGPGWIGWDNGINADAIGLNGGGTFYVAARFTSSQLFEYEGCSLTRIRLFPYAPNGSITLKVWAGDNAGALLSSQVVTSYTAGTWNEFMLQTPVFVTCTSELWVGYEVNHNPTDYVAGCDTGPAIAGFGDMISLDGEVWEPMSIAYGLNYNWNIQGFVEPVAGTGTFIGAANEPRDSKSSSHGFVNHRQRALLGYDIYRDGDYIATTQELSYFDSCADIGGVSSAEYDIKAVYEDCESVLVNTYIWGFFCPPVGVSYEITEDLKIYPNPSADLIWIDTRDMSGSLLVYSFSGKLLLENHVSNNDKPVISLKHYPDGAYLIKFVSDAGETYTGKIQKCR